MRKRFFKLFLLSLFSALIFLNYRDFALDYWFNYPLRVNQNFEKPVHKVFDYAAFLSKKENLPVYIEEEIMTWRPPTFSFFEHAYFPSGLKKWKEEHGLFVNSITIVSSPTFSRILKPSNIEVWDYGDTAFFLLINRSNKDE